MSEPIAGNPMADEMIADMRRVLESQPCYPYTLLPSEIRALLARISRPSITADAVAYQRRFKLRSGEWDGWELISKDMFVRHKADPYGHREERALFTHPAPEGAEDLSTNVVGLLEHRIGAPNVFIEEGSPHERHVEAGDTEPGDLVERLKDRAENAYGDTYGCQDQVLDRRLIAALTSLRTERDALDFKLIKQREATIAEKQRVVDLEQHAKDLEGVITARSANEIDALHAFEQRVAEMEQYAREATKAITSLTVGGSEYFGRKIGEMYTADLALCVQHVRERDTRTHDWMTKAVSERKAAEQRVAALEGALTETKSYLSAIGHHIDEHRFSLALGIVAQIERAIDAALRPAETGEPTNAR